MPNVVMMPTKGEGIELQNVFNYGGQQVRTVIMEGEPWFVAKDVCDVLGLSNSRKAVSSLSEKQKADVTISYTSFNGVVQRRSVAAINEAGVYKLVFKSRKPEAEKFTDWIVEEVIPTIRKHGAYMTPETLERTLTDPDFLIGILTELKNEQQRRREVEAENAVLKPKADIWDVIASAKNTQEFDEVAKMLNVPKMGRNNLMKFLRVEGILQADPVKKNNPYQKYVDAGYFKLLEKTYEMNTIDGPMPFVNTKTVVTPKGIEFIYRRLVKAGYSPKL